MIEPKDLTIIIPHLGGTKEQCYSLKETLISFWETSKSKIIVAKNGGANCFNPNQCIGHTFIIEEQGQCKAVNAAVATVDTPWIFVSNDDMIYAPRWFENLTSNIPENVKCISPKLIEPRPGAPTFEVYFCGGAGGDFDKDKWLEFAKNYHYPPEGMTRKLRTGFNLPFLIKKELWDLIGGYDINYDPWGSNGDSDLEYKIKLAGVQSYQNPNAIVYHFSQTSGTFEPRNDSYRFANYAYFKEKWGFDRTDDGIWEASFTIPLPRSRGGERVYTPDWEGKYANY